MVLPPYEGDHTYCRIPARDIEHQGILGFSAFPRLKRVVTISSGVSGDLSPLGSTRYGSVCLQSISPCSSLHGMETGSKKSGNRCLTAGLVSYLALCISSILTDREGLGQSEQREDMPNPGNTCLANTTMVQSVVGNGCSSTTVYASIARSVSRSSKKSTPTYSKQNLKVSGMENIWKKHGK